MSQTKAKQENTKMTSQEIQSASKRLTFSALSL